MLCASAYTAGDCRFIRSYLNKTYKWGYFPPVKNYDNPQEIIDNKKPNSILWAGRFLKLKHTLDAISMAKDLKNLGYDFHLTIIGDGEMKGKMIRSIKKYALESYVEILDFMSPEELRKYMERADIYLFTSNKQEGWGAVLNESMNSMCAVVANKEIGSVPYLIKNGKSGLIYNRKKKGDLTKKVKSLLDDKEYKKSLQLGAYQTLTNVWNAEEAADRLLNLVDDINNNNEPRYLDGPCSRD